LICPGRALASATKPFTDETGSDGCVISSSGESVVWLTGRKSRIGSYCRFLCIIGASTSVVMPPRYIVYPSAGDLTKSIAPITPPPPGRLSITTFCPQLSVSFCPSSRPRMSVGPPAGKDMTILSGLDG
jgi:hypothetical protein